MANYTVTFFDHNKNIADTRVFNTVIDPDTLVYEIEMDDKTVFSLHKDGIELYRSIASISDFTHMVDLYV